MVSTRAGAMSRRNRMMHPRMTCDHEAGGSSPQTAVGEGCVRQGFTEADRERTHHCTIPRSQRNPTVIERQRSKNAHLHSDTVTPTPTSVKTADSRADTGPLGALSC